MFIIIIRDPLVVLLSFSYKLYVTVTDKPVISKYDHMYCYNNSVRRDFEIL